MLAIARVIGETAPLLIVCGSPRRINTNLFDGRMTTLPVFAYYSVRAARRPARGRLSTGLGARRSC